MKLHDQSALFTAEEQECINAQILILVFIFTTISMVNTQDV